MTFSEALPHHKPVSFHRAGGYTLLETIIAFVVLIVFVVLAYSFAFRNPASMSELKSRPPEQRGIPEVKPPGSKKVEEAPASPSPSGTAGR